LRSRQSFRSHVGQSRNERTGCHCEYGTSASPQVGSGRLEFGERPSSSPEERVR
jgi:hypothetical protein